MKKLYRGPYIDAFCQVWFHLVHLFQRSRLKYEKLTDGRRFSKFQSLQLFHCLPINHYWLFQFWDYDITIIYLRTLQCLISNYRISTCVIFHRYISEKNHFQVWFHLVHLFQRSRLKYEKLTDGRRTDNGRQVMAIPHMTLWVRWAKKWDKCPLLITQLDEILISK
jgi:hypothetical protein